MTEISGRTTTARQKCKRDATNCRQDVGEWPSLPLIIIIMPHVPYPISYVQWLVPHYLSLCPVPHVLWPLCPLCQGSNSFLYPPAPYSNLCPVTFTPYLTAMSHTKYLVPFVPCHPTSIPLCSVPSMTAHLITHSYMLLCTHHSCVYVMP